MRSVLSSRGTCACGVPQQSSATISVPTAGLPLKEGASLESSLSALPVEGIYSRIPLTPEELSLKGQALKNLIAKRYGPPDIPNITYGYV